MWRVWQILQERHWECVCDQFKRLAEAADWITGCKQNGVEEQTREEEREIQTGHNRKSPQRLTEEI